MYKEYNYVQKRLDCFTKLKQSIPFWVRICTNDIYKQLNIHIVESIKYPKYRFSHYCSMNGRYQTITIVMDFAMINRFKQYIQQNIKKDRVQRTDSISKKGRKEK